VASAHAQDVPVKAHIPFAFTVGSTTLPAGNYSLYSLAKYSQRVWVVRSDQGGPEIFAMVGPTMLTSSRRYGGWGRQPRCPRRRRNASWSARWRVTVRSFSQSTCWPAPGKAQAEE
jgi:hypothetical protein